MKRNGSTRAYRAFTLIELLVVIAIIAILAAILFPVFGTVREQTRQGSTMSNMHAVYLGARLFYEDEGRYPSSLFGYAEVSLNNVPYDPTKPLARPALPSDVGNSKVAITPMDQATGSFYTDTTSTGRSLNKGYLYREQVKDFNTFVNGETPLSHQQTGKTAVTFAVTPATLPTLDNGTVLGNQQVVWTPPSLVSPGSKGCSVYGDTDLPADPTYDGQRKVFYAMDSMDIGPRINLDGSIATDANGTIYELHYSPDWTKERYDSKNGCDSVGNQPIPGQLKYKNPPTERTVLTYITDHVAFGHSPNVLILLMSGTARTVNYKQALFDKNNALPFGYH